MPAPEDGTQTSGTYPALGKEMFDGRICEQCSSSGHDRARASLRNNLPCLGCWNSGLDGQAVVQLGECVQHGKLYLYSWCTAAGPTSPASATQPAHAMNIQAGHGVARRTRGPPPSYSACRSPPAATSAGPFRGRIPDCPPRGSAPARCDSSQFSLSRFRCVMKTPQPHGRTYRPRALGQSEVGQSLHPPISGEMHAFLEAERDASRQDWGKRPAARCCVERSDCQTGYGRDRRQYLLLVSIAPPGRPP